MVCRRAVALAGFIHWILCISGGAAGIVEPRARPPNRRDEFSAERPAIQSYDVRGAPAGAGVVCSGSLEAWVGTIDCRGPRSEARGDAAGCIAGNISRIRGMDGIVVVAISGRSRIARAEHFARLGERSSGPSAAGFW